MRVVTAPSGRRVVEIGLAAAVAAASAVAAAAALFALRDARIVAIAAAGLALAVASASHAAAELRHDFRAPLNHVWIAALDALADNGLAFDESTRRGATEGRVHARGARILVEQHPGGVVRMRVRCGVFDTAEHRRRAGLILERAARYVGSDAPPRGA